MKHFFFLFLIAGFVSCKTDNSVSVVLSSDQNGIDTLIIKEEFDGKDLVRFTFRNRLDTFFNFENDTPVIARISSVLTGKSSQIILYPSKDLNVSIRTSYGIKSHCIEDSLLSDLPQSTNKFLAENTAYIFGGGSLEFIIERAKEFMEDRRENLSEMTTQVPDGVLDLLHFQNKARVYSLLFYVGRIVRKLPASSSFYSFLDDIDPNSAFHRSNPQNLLYKYELEYLRTHDSIEDVSSFVDYISGNTNNDDLRAFLKAIYIDGMITEASYWQEHQNGLNAKKLSQLVAKEENNPYKYLFKRSIKSFYSSQNGMPAFDFEAERKDGSKVKLSDFRGKIVFIDVWASWCGPCLNQKPSVLKMAEKYKDRDDLEILFISVDKKEDWLNFMNGESPAEEVTELIIAEGINTEFGNSFNIKLIPKYMVIDRSGFIIDANFDGPGPGFEEAFSEFLNM